MNKAKFYLFILILSGLVWVSCEKKVVYPPQATIKNTHIIVTPIPHSSMGINGSGGYCEPYGYEWIPYVTYTNHMLYIYGENVSGGPTSDYGFVLNLLVKDTGVYVLSNINTGMYEYVVIPGGVGNPIITDYYTDKVHIGKLNLTLLDTINHYASGTFSFVAQEQTPTRNGQLDTVTNGYFNYLTW